MDAFFLRRYSVEVCEKTPSPLLVRNKGLTLAVRQSSGHIVLDKTSEIFLNIAMGYP
jgi:hypothetical protein